MFPSKLLSSFVYYKLNIIFQLLFDILERKGM